MSEIIDDELRANFTPEGYEQIKREANSQVKRADIPVTPELVADWLCLPDGIAIVSCRYDIIRRVIVFHLRGEGLPDNCLCDFGAKPLEITPTYRVKDHELVSLGEPHV